MIGYYITRRIGSNEDTLSTLFEGEELPTFKRDGNPYVFTDKAVANRVLWRLEARHPRHLFGQPIKYDIESFDDSVKVDHPPTQHLAMFL